MLDSHKVSKARDLNINSSTEEDKAPDFGQRNIASPMRRMCSACCSVEERDHNEDGKNA